MKYLVVSRCDHGRVWRTITSDCSPEWMFAWAHEVGCSPDDGIGWGMTMTLDDDADESTDNLPELLARHGVLS